MTATPTDFVAATRTDGAAERAPSAIGKQWAALQDAAAAVAEMAGLATEKPSAPVRDFPALIGDVGGWRLKLASDGVSDMAAMMTPGVKALLAVAARGQDPTAAALTLWREYHHARTALLALLPEPEASQAPAG